MAEEAPQIDRAQLLEILKRWQDGSLTQEKVQEFAERMTDKYDFPELPHNDDQSIPVEVLFHLDASPGLLVTKHDVPAMIAFLQTPLGEAENGWRAWLAYWNSVDDQVVQ